MKLIKNPIRRFTRRFFPLKFRLCVKSNNWTHLLPLLRIYNDWKYRYYNHLHSNAIPSWTFIKNHYLFPDLYQDFFTKCLL